MTKMTKAHFKNVAIGDAVYGLIDVGNGKFESVLVTGIADGIVQYKVDDDSFHYMNEEVFMKCVYKDPF